MSPISFETKVFKINSWTILRLPMDISAKLPSRGQVLVEGTINDQHFKSPLEPDGKKSHWLRVDDILGKKVNVGDTVKLEIEPSKEWPEPKVPEDIQTAMVSSPQTNTMWNDITPMARWDWIRWIVSTKNPETRKKRITVALDKMRKGSRRPCCFNRNMCCEPFVSNNGILLDPVEN